MTYKDIEGWFNMEEQYLELLKSTPENGIFVELGAWMGKSTRFLVEEIIKRKKKVRFYTIDTFQGTVDSSEKRENEAYSKYDLNSIYDKYLENTKDISSYYHTLRSESDKAADFFDDNSVDTIFIDAGHSYESVLADLQAWYPKMKNESIMAGHDFNAWNGVNKAFREFFVVEPDKVVNDCWFLKIKK